MFFVLSTTFFKLFYFLSTLTLFCYIGSIYYVDAYSINNPNIFDLFYYVVITFGTIGYGDIYPICYYTKAIAILIVFTSISCISIMLSSFLSVSHEKINRPTKKEVIPKHRYNFFFIIHF